MILTLDVGNTNMTGGVFQEGEIIATFRITTKIPRTSDEYGFMIMNFLTTSKVNPEEIEDVIISSVVPKIMHSFTNSIPHQAAMSVMQISFRALQ